MRLTILLLVVLCATTVFGKGEKPEPTGELLSMAYLSTHSFADALLKFKSVDDKLKVNGADKERIVAVGTCVFYHCQQR
jgi:hypothetical protein